MDTMQYTHLYRSPLGTITLAADSEGLTGLWFEGQKYFAATLDAQHEETMLPIFEQTPTERSPVKSPAGKARKPSRHKP